VKRQILDFKDTDQIIESPVEDTLYVIAPGDWKGQKSLVVSLEHPGVSCKIRCGYKAASGNVIDLVTTVVHEAPNTGSDTIIRGVLYDGGISNYIGKVIVKKSARDSSSNLENATLVIGEATHNHIEPIMQIETSDVSASHSSFTGRVDKDQIYYLQSRGLSEEEAQELLVDAFLKPVGV